MSAGNASSVSSNVMVLGYGCIYQGGYLFAVDDTTNTTGSIKGTVVATADQVSASTGIIWSSNGTSGNYSYDIIPGTDEMSTTSPQNQSPAYSGNYPSFVSMFHYPTNLSGTYTNAAPNPALPFATCNGSTNGYCNTQNIVLFYNQYKTNYSSTCDPQNGGSGGCLATGPTTPPPPATSLGTYAAGLCTNYSVGSYTNWYLPAICELDSTNTGTPSPCASYTPQPQSITGTLTALIGSSSNTCTISGAPTNSNCLSGYYWSSTEGSSNPQNLVWYERFFSGGSYPGPNEGKEAAFGVRCVRGF